MNIMYLLFSFTIGGTEKLVTDICNEMSKKGNNVFLYIINDHYDEVMLNRLNSNVVIELEGRKSGKGNVLLSSKKISEYCRKNKINVIHCNSFNCPEIIFWTRLCNRKIKIVHTIHDVGQYSKLNKLRVAYRNIVCDSFLAISESVKDDLLSSGANIEKVKVVYNAIDLDYFKRKTDYYFNNECIRVGNVARINLEKKGQDILFDAVEMLSEKYRISCNFAGGADEFHKKDYEELIKRKKCLKSENLEINFWGAVENVRDFLENIDIFVLPSRYEGFGISLIEAMHMKIPCIASDIDGPKEIIGDDERGLLFQSGNPQKLSDCIEKIIIDVNLRSSLSERAYAYVDSNFDITNMCDILLKEYSL